MPGHPGERQPGHNPYKPVEFPPYQGKRNFPTWSVYTTMTSYFETYDVLRRLAVYNPGGMGNVRRAVIGTVNSYLQGGKPSIHDEPAKVLVQGFLMNAVRRVAWTPVYDTLRGERKELGEVDELTGLTYQLLSNANWRPIVQGAKYLTEADDRLQSWVEDQSMIWLNSLE